MRYRLHAWFDVDIPASQDVEPEEIRGRMIKAIHNVTGEEPAVSFGAETYTSRNDFAR